MTAPLLAPGYLLLRDAVSTPRSYLSDAALGLSEAAPRALPQDFAVAVGSRVLDGDVVVKALLIGRAVAGGVGRRAARRPWCCRRRVAGQFVAVTLAIWNPYVAERLLQGHWSLLVGYGACRGWRRRCCGCGDGRRRRLVARCRSGWRWPGLTPTGLLLAATVAVVCVLAPGAGRPRWACAAVGIGVAVLVALPWLVASVLAGSLSSTQAAGVPAFAARAEPGLGTLGSLAGLGGIWNATAVPDSRTTLFAVVGTVVLLVVVALGLPTVLRRPAAVPLLVLAAVAVVLPAAMATGPGVALVESLVRTCPASGCCGTARSGWRWQCPATALAGAAAVVTLRPRVPARRRHGVLRGADGGAARPGVGGRRQGDRGALPAGRGRRSRR